MVDGGTRGMERMERMEYEGTEWVAEMGRLIGRDNRGVCVWHMIQVT
jgi:hypothetical protein